MIQPASASNLAVQDAKTMGMINFTAGAFAAPAAAAPVEIPEWFDPALEGLLSRKKNRKRSGLHFFDRAVFQSLELLARPKGWSYTQPLAWSDLETMMDHDCERIRDAGYAPDLVVGVKSGGAFIANYVARRLGVRDVRYLQVKYYSPILGSTVLAFLTKGLRKAQLHVDAPIPADGRRVLLVDDQIYTGKTINTARDWLHGQGAEAIKTYCLYSACETTDFCYRQGRMNYVPWGDDP